MTNFNIVPPRLAVKAMRDSGYKNAAYAIAELVDNAIQANAELVEIMCREEEELVKRRVRARVKEIAVLDNGGGMAPDALRRALQFGNGERLSDRTGIGRFGMGLPNSSLSQARRVEVWSWQDGPASAYYTYLDIDQISAGDLAEVPAPRKAAPPELWLARSATVQVPRTGTLVVWSNLDRCEWRTALAIFKNSESTVGRVYRRFIASGRVQIRMVAFVDNEAAARIDDFARSNDPMYLMQNTSCAAPWEDAAMFELYGKPLSFDAKVLHEGAWVTGTAVVRFSVALPEARRGDNAGATKHGKHAGENIGVSIMRADRELELQREWCIGYDPRERWWGCEVEFDPIFDETFGVTNNKQHARSLAEFALLAEDEIARREGYTSIEQLKAEWEDEQDPRLILLRIKTAIESNLAAIRRTIKAHGERTRTKVRHDPTSAEGRGTRATQERQSEGYRGESDRGEALPPEERTRQIADELAARGLGPLEATERAGVVLGDGRKFEFLPADLETSEFFSVRPRGGVIIIGLNTNHPAYANLLTVMEGVGESEDLGALRGRLQRAYEALKLLLEAWARYEDELPEKQKQAARDIRYEWGKVARQFFETP